MDVITNNSFWFLSKEETYHSLREIIYEEKKDNGRIYNYSIYDYDSHRSEHAQDTH